MKIQHLFDELIAITKNTESDFEDSGMINRFQEMQYGFFPLCWGILTENNKLVETTPTTEIEEGAVMVLGNDFGTRNYVNGYVSNPEKRVGEIDSKTIINLLNAKVGINTSKTFFTNFYLGVRVNEKATMTKRVEDLTSGYKSLCFEFFVKQVNFIKPSIIICLGHDVKNALIDSKTSFDKWAPKSNSIKRIHHECKHVLESEIFGDRKFVLIPHPCDLRNFNESHMLKLNSILNN